MKNNQSLLEAVADIAYCAGINRYYGGDSRQDISDIIDAAKKFETINKQVKWGIDEDREYIDEIEAYADNLFPAKKKESLVKLDKNKLIMTGLYLRAYQSQFKKSQVGYIDLQKLIPEIDRLILLSK